MDKRAKITGEGRHSETNQRQPVILTVTRDTRVKMLNIVNFILAVSVDYVAIVSHRVKVDYCITTANLLHLTHLQQKQTSHAADVTCCTRHTH